MAGKGGLANQLLGRMVRPRLDWGQPDDPESIGSANKRIWAWCKPSASGEYVAIIEAVWTDKDGNVKALVSDPFGNMKEMWLENVRLSQ